MKRIRTHLNTLMLAGLVLSLLGGALSHFAFGDTHPLIWMIPVLLTLAVGVANWWYNRGAESDSARIDEAVQDTLEGQDVLARHMAIGTPGNPFVAEAERHLAQGSEEQATRNFERALRANADDMRALLSIGALSFFRCIVARTLGHADAYREHLDRALTHLEHAYSLEPHNPFVLEGLACALDEREGASPRAIAMLEELTRIAPDHRSAHANLGVAYMRAGRGDDAKREFLHQIDHANEFLGIFHLGEYYRSTGQLCHASICYDYTIAAARRYILGLQTGSQRGFAIHNLAVQDYIHCLVRLSLIGAAINTVDEAVAVWKQYGQPIPVWVPRQRRGLKVLRRLYRMAHCGFLIRRALHRPTRQGRANRLMREEYLKPLVDNEHYYELVQVYRHAISLEPLAAIPHVNQAAILYAYGNTDDAQSEAALALALGHRNRDSEAIKGAQAVLALPDDGAGEAQLTDEDVLIQQIAMAAIATRRGEEPPRPGATTPEAQNHSTLS